MYTLDRIVGDVVFNESHGYSKEFEQNLFEVHNAYGKLACAKIAMMRSYLDQFEADITNGEHLGSIQGMVHSFSKKVDNFLKQ